MLLRMFTLIHGKQLLVPNPSLNGRFYNMLNLDRDRLQMVNNNNNNRKHFQFTFSLQICINLL